MAPEPLDFVEEQRVIFQFSSKSKTNAAFAALAIEHSQRGICTAKGGGCLFSSEGIPC